MPGSYVARGAGRAAGASSRPAPRATALTRPTPPSAAFLALSAGLAAGLLSACATGPGSAETIPADAVESTRTEANGDVVTEYRVDGRLRALRVQPSRGPTYYLYDRNGDGVVDEERDGVSPVYFKLFEWN